MPVTSTAVQETFSLQSYTELVVFDASADRCPHIALTTPGKLRREEEVRPREGSEINTPCILWPLSGGDEFGLRRAWPSSD